MTLVKRIFPSYSFSYPAYFSFSELTSLPAIPPSSPLKRLFADNCSIKLIHPSILRPSLDLRLQNNKIKELPHKEMLEFLEQGGNLLRLNNNPFIYPPKYVFDITQMLQALSIRGSVVWRAGSKVILHKISLFYHAMQLLLGNFAEFHELKPSEIDLLIRAYKDGQLPLPFIKSMFVHLHKELKGSAEGLSIGFDDLDFSSTNIESEMLMESVLSILSQLNIIVLMDEKVLEMKMYFIPHLLFRTSDGDNVETFIATTLTPRPPYALALCFTSETKICKKTISKHFAMTTSVMQRLASIVDKKLILRTRQDAIVAKVSHVEVAVYTPQSPEGNLLKLMVSLTTDTLPELAWIVLNEVSANDDLADVDCQLVCPLDDPECEHGDYDPQATNHGDSLEDDTRNKRKRMKKLKCHRWYCFPSRLAVKIMSLFHPKDGRCVSPLLIDPSTPGEARADYLETSVILSVIGTQAVERESIEASLEHLPAFCQDNYIKFFKYVVPVKQYFDSNSQCPHQESCKCKSSKDNCRCKCYLSSEEYIRSFLLLERNSAKVTKGEWTQPLKAIMDKYTEYNHECPSHSCSVTAMVRVVRNLVAHNTGQVLDDKFWSELRAKFDLLIMHSFGAKVDLLHDEDPVLCLFAKAFNKIETKMHGNYEEPSLPLLRVTIILLDGTEKETVLYFDLAVLQRMHSKESNPLEFLRLKVVDVFQLDKNFQGKIIYKGNEKAYLADEIHLTKPTHITDLSLDTGVIHFIHIQEWEVRVEFVTSLKAVHTMFCSSHSMTKVTEFVQIQAGNKNLCLYHVKEMTSYSAYSNIIQINSRPISAFPVEEEFSKEMKKVDGSQAIGTLSKEACQLVALDEHQLNEYFRTVKQNERAGRQTSDIFDNSDPKSDEEGALSGIFGDLEYSQCR